MATKADLLYDKVTETLDYLYSDELLDPIMADVINDIKTVFVDSFDEEKLKEKRELYRQELESNRRVREAQDDALRSFNFSK